MHNLLPPPLAKALACAKTGDAFLVEQLGEEYWRRVNRSILSMAHPSLCVAAQAFGLFYSEVRARFKFSEKQEIGYGFTDDSLNTECPVTYQDLNRAWNFILVGKSVSNLGSSLKEGIVERTLTPQLLSFLFPAKVIASKRAHEGDRFLTLLFGEDYWRNIDRENFHCSDAYRCPAAQASGMHYSQFQQLSLLTAQEQVSLGFWRDEEVTSLDLNEAWIGVFKEKEENYAASLTPAQKGT